MGMMTTASDTENFSISHPCIIQAFVAITPVPFLREKAPCKNFRSPRFVLGKPQTPQARVTRPDPVTILDYGAGNVSSLENAVRHLGYATTRVRNPQDIDQAHHLIFPGVGAFGQAMDALHHLGYRDALLNYLKDYNRPFLGICIGLQGLFQGSEENSEVGGLGVFQGTVKRFKGVGVSVPHIGWNTLEINKNRPVSRLVRGLEGERFYFVHSFCVKGEEETIEIGSGGDADRREWVLGSTMHGEQFVSILQKGRVCATQFHPEKSGEAGLALLNNFLSARDIASPLTGDDMRQRLTVSDVGLAKRIVACLDVRENDQGDLVVTKGDQYDVREKSQHSNVRNLGKPVQLAHRYYREGADEITFLNITSFRGEPMSDAPMLQVLKETSKGVFVPLCIGGGIRDYTDKNGQFHSSLDVATCYFRAGADKISLGSDAVYAAEKFYANGERGDGRSSIEMISRVYGAQAVVISIDPRRVYVDSQSETSHQCVQDQNGQYYWYQCTVKGGREGRDLDVMQLAIACESLGAGEILVNSMDRDGQNQGYDIKLIQMVKNAVDIPVIASSGAGRSEHFTECFDQTDVEAALAAGIFHRKEVSIREVKEYMRNHGTRVRLSNASPQLAVTRR